MTTLEDFVRHPGQFLERYAATAINAHLKAYYKRAEEVQAEEDSLSNESKDADRQLAEIKKKAGGSVMMRLGLLKKQMEEDQQKHQYLTKRKVEIKRTLQGLRPLEYFIVAASKTNPSTRHENARFKCKLDQEGSVVLNGFYATHPKSQPFKEYDLNELARTLKSQNYEVVAYKIEDQQFQKVSV